MRLIIANSALRDSLAIYHRISNARSWATRLVGYLSLHIQRALVSYAPRWLSIIAYPTRARELRASLAIYHRISNARSWATRLVGYLSSHIQRALVSYAPRWLSIIAYPTRASWATRLVGFLSSHIQRALVSYAPRWLSIIAYPTRARELRASLAIYHRISTARSWATRLVGYLSSHIQCALVSYAPRWLSIIAYPTRARDIKQQHVKLSFCNSNHFMKRIDQSLRRAFSRVAIM